MDGYAVTIRLLIPPLHEFLPKTCKDIKEFAEDMQISVNNDFIILAAASCGKKYLMK